MASRFVFVLKILKKGEHIMKMKKLLAAFLSAAMAVTSVAIPVFADEDAPKESAEDVIALADYTWTGSGDTESQCDNIRLTLLMI